MLAVALVDLAQDNQRRRQVVEQPEAPVERDGRLRRLYAFRLAPVGQRAVGYRQVGIEPGLEAEIADFLGHLKSPTAGIDAAVRVERAIEHAKIRVATACGLQQIVLLRQADAPLDLVDRLGRPSGARERDTDR